jgi:3-methyladenine DNA glycosylase Tag
VHAIGGKKETCEKRRKSSMQEEKKHDVQAGKPNRDRVRVFEKYCNDYKPIK